VKSFQTDDSKLMKGQHPEIEVKGGGGGNRRRRKRKKEVEEQQEMACILKAHPRCVFRSSSSLPNGNCSDVTSQYVTLRECSAIAAGLLFLTGVLAVSVYLQQVN